jgi:hypothetical protein
LFGTAKEMFVNAQAVMSGVKDYPENVLIQTILPNAKGDASAAMDKMKKLRAWGVTRYEAKGVDSSGKFLAQAVEDCKEVEAVLAAKASKQEATEYKLWAISIAEKVAMAATEGGFLGFGGERFSSNEKHFFSQIESALGMQSLLA